ncbi:hypothetical protein ACFFX0_09480 [Citricoccus parietis]|uniref:Uncharacterized protein n=1 Tax=Citricoccus parietis TaxID=592307 RepID=A0ABV5FXL1_9MICC
MPALAVFCAVIAICARAASRPRAAVFSEWKVLSPMMSLCLPFSPGGR